MHLHLKHKYTFKRSLYDILFHFIAASVQLNSRNNKIVVNIF